MRLGKNHPQGPNQTVTRLTDDPTEEQAVLTWDTAVEAMGGDLLQSSRWGAFKRQHGWQIEHVTSHGGARAQLLFRHVGPFSQAYLPRGPVFPENAGDSLDLLEKIDAECGRHRAISLIVEPGQPLPEAWLTQPGFTVASFTIQSPRTVLVDVTLEDTALLRQMRKDTRYNLGYAQRNGIVIDEAPVSGDSIDWFYSLIAASSQRKQFGIHDRTYYEDFLRIFDDRAVLLVARRDAAVTAALIAAQFGHGARSMYAGALGAQAVRGDTALLRFEAMRWARRQGCTTYDLGGIAPAADDQSGLQGVERFKTGFGGEIVVFPPTMERTYHPFLASLSTRLRSVLSRSGV